MALALTITEVTGEQRELRMEGAALPTSMTGLGGDFAEKLTWYPGQREGSSQGLGPREQPLEMSGYWTDTHLGSEEAQTLIQLADSMRIEGRECLLEFDDNIRRGRILTFTWEILIAGVDYTWDMRFSVHSRDWAPSAFIFAAEGTAPAARLDTMETALEALEVPPPERMQNTTRTSLLASVSRIRNGMTRVRTAIETPQALIPGTARGIVSMIADMEADAILLRDTAGSLEADLTVMTTGRGIDRLTGTVYIGELLGNSAIFVDVVRRQRAAFERIARGPARTLHDVREGESLASIAMRHYGSALHWQDIATHNGLLSLELFPGTILAIPDVTTRRESA